MIRHLFIWTRRNPMSVVIPIAALLTMSGLAFSLTLNALSLYLDDHGMTWLPIAAAWTAALAWPVIIWLGEFTWYHRGSHAATGRIMNDLFGDGMAERERHLEVNDSEAPPAA